MPRNTSTTRKKFSLALCCAHVRVFPTAAAAATEISAHELKINVMSRQRTLEQECSKTAEECRNISDRVRRRSDLETT